MNDKRVTIAEAEITQGEKIEEGNLYFNMVKNAIHIFIKKHLEMRSVTDEEKQ